MSALKLTYDLLLQSGCSQSLTPPSMYFLQYDMQSFRDSAHSLDSFLNSDSNDFTILCEIF